MEYVEQGDSVLFSFGNIRVRVDGSICSVLASYDYTLLCESNKRVRSFFGEGKASVSSEEKLLLETESQEEVLSFFMDAAKKGLSIQRYKGLGEMNPEQLWETTMEPTNRTLLQVKIEDVVEADNVFTVLMGDQVEPRREFIEQNALNVSNLDI